MEQQEIKMTPRPQHGDDKDSANASTEHYRAQSSQDSRGVLTMNSLEAAVGKASLSQQQQQTSASAKSRGGGAQAGGGGEEESSSSSGGQGEAGSNGSGGYSADYSSSDCSSDTSKGSAGKTIKTTILQDLNSRNGGGNDTMMSMNTHHHHSHSGSTTSMAELKQTVESGGGRSADGGSGERLLPAVGAGVTLQQMQTSLGQQTLSGTVGLPSFQVPYPQWNGVRIQHPMDPRIDLNRGQQQQQQLPEQNFPAAFDPSQQNQYLSTIAGTAVGAASHSQTSSSLLPMGEMQPTVDHYLDLLEAVRPFFNSYGAPAPVPPSLNSNNNNNNNNNEAADHHHQKPNGGSGSDETQNLSSEGFTSFFTTTNSNQTSSDDALKSPGQLAANNEGSPPAVLRAPPVAVGVARAPQASGEDASADESDSSSMVVLARVKRKHLRKREGFENTTVAESSTTATERKVRIEQQQQQQQEEMAENFDRAMQDVIQDQQQQEEIAENFDREMQDDRAIQDQREESVAAAAVAVAQAAAPEQQQLQQPLQQQAPAAAAAAAAVQEAQQQPPPREDEPRESSSSSSSEEQQQIVNNGPPQGGALQQIQQENAQVGGGGLHRYTMPPRIVSESSERNGSSSASRTMTTTTSGSGSGGDSGAKSGSANGSSGSGNEGKGSSTDNAKGENDNSGGDLNSNSDEGNGKKEHAQHLLNPLANPEHPLQATVGALHRHVLPSSGLPDSPAFDSPAVHAPANNKPPIHTQDAQTNEGQDNAVRERLLDKKRKRMNMRREYEEQVEQQMESSESSSSGEVFLRPGKPVTLDEVLGFTKTPRLVVQAMPPFLLVYANAAYSALTSIDSHSAIGKPISAMLSIPEMTEKSHSATGDDVAASGRQAPEGNADGGESMSLSGISSATPSSAQRVSLPANGQPNNGQDADHNNDANQDGVGGHVAAAAAGRARAASVMDDPHEMCLERLVAASGFGRYHMINVAAKNHMAGRTVTAVHQVSFDLDGRTTFGRGNGTANGSTRDEHGSHGSSIPSVPQFYAVSCRMGVSPVVSSPNAMDYTVVTDNQAEPTNHHHSKKHHQASKGGSEKSSSKRRKHLHGAVGHGGHDHRGENGEQLSSRHSHRRVLTLKDEKQRDAQRNTITHYVIQLDPMGGSSRQRGGVNGGVGGGGTAGGSLSSASTSTTAEARIYGVPKAELKRRRLALNGGDAAAGGEAAAASENSFSVASEQLPYPDGGGGAVAPNPPVPQREGGGGGADIAGNAEDEQVELDSQATPPVSACG